MPGNRKGGLRAAKTNLERHGEDFYSRIGRKGGMSGHSGGFKKGSELARLAGRKGGLKSRRGEPVAATKVAPYKDDVIKMLRDGFSTRQIAEMYKVSYYVMYRFVKGLREHGEV